MKKIFADSVYWIALAYPRDQWHEASVKVSRGLTGVRVVTTQEVLSEFLTAFRHLPELRTVAVRQVDLILANRQVEVFPQSSESFEAGLALYRARLDKAYSLVDCISMEWMRRNELTSVLTHDAHFSQEGFQILL